MKTLEIKLKDGRVMEYEACKVEIDIVSYGYSITTFDADGTPLQGLGLYFEDVEKINLK